LLSQTLVSLSPRDRTENEKYLFSRGDFCRQRQIGRFERKVLPAHKESQKGAALLRDMIADGPPQHRVTRLERVEDGTRRNGTLDGNLNFGARLRQPLQVIWKHDTYQGSVWTSTENTAGRSRTMALQLSPPSGDM